MLSACWPCIGLLLPSQGSSKPCWSTRTVDDVIYPVHVCIAAGVDVGEARVPAAVSCAHHTHVVLPQVICVYPC